MSSTPNTGVPQPKLLHPTRILRKMTVSKVIDYNPQIRELFINCMDPKEFEFKAGQFVMLHVPPDLSNGPNDASGKPLKPALRAYSIASTDEQRDGYRLVFKYVDGGIASKFVWDLQAGAVLDFTGPFGRVFFKEPPTEQIIFMNTGSGISQHYSFIESNLKKFPNLKYRLLFGVRGILRVGAGKNDRAESIVVVVASHGFSDASLASVPEKVHRFSTVIAIPFELLPLRRDR